MLTEKNRFGFSIRGLGRNVILLGIVSLLAFINEPRENGATA